MNTPLNNSTGATEPPTGVYALISSLMVTFLNGASLLVVFKSKVIKSKMKICFIGQLTTDFLIGIVGMASGLNMVVNRGKTDLFCFITNYSGFMCGVVTSFMVLLQAMDRFLVLRFTFIYTTWITTSKMIILVIILYVFGISTVGIMFYVDYEYIECSVFSVAGRSGYIYVVTIFTCCIVMVICLHGYIWKKVREHTKRINDVEGFQRSLLPGIFSATEIRNLGTMIITVTLYCICYLPLVITILDLVMNNWDNRLYHDQKGYLTILLNLYLANSLLNPLVYIWRLKLLRLDILHSFRAYFHFAEVDTTRTSGDRNAREQT